MGRLLIIGCGGVAGVAIHKCCQNIFRDLHRQQNERKM